MEKKPKKHKKMIFFMKNLLKFLIWLCYNDTAVALTSSLSRPVGAIK